MDIIGIVLTLVFTLSVSTFSKNHSRSKNQIVFITSQILTIVNVKKYIRASDVIFNETIPFVRNPPLNSTCVHWILHGVV